MGHTYTITWFVAYLKFKCNRVSYRLSGNPSPSWHATNFLGRGHFESTSKQTVFLGSKTRLALQGLSTVYLWLMVLLLKLLFWSVSSCFPLLCPVLHLLALVTLPVSSLPTHWSSCHVAWCSFSSLTPIVSAQLQLAFVLGTSPAQSGQAWASTCQGKSHSAFKASVRSRALLGHSRNNDLESSLLCPSLPLMCVLHRVDSNSLPGLK